jgi:hypothetical protein
MSGQFELWRLLVGITLCAVSIGAVRTFIVEVRDYGVGFFPIVCLIVGILCAAAACGILFRRARELATRAALWLMRLLEFW